MTLEDCRQLVEDFITGTCNEGGGTLQKKTVDETFTGMDGCAQENPEEFPKDCFCLKGLLCR